VVVKGKLMEEREVTQGGGRGCPGKANGRPGKGGSENIIRKKDDRKPEGGRFFCVHGTERYMPLTQLVPARE
jgi:hypothetical protein